MSNATINTIENLLMVYSDKLMDQSGTTTNEVHKLETARTAAILLHIANALRDGDPPLKHLCEPGEGKCEETKN